LSIDEEQMINRTTPRFVGFVYNPPLKKPTACLKRGYCPGWEDKNRGARNSRPHAGSMSYLVNDSILFVGDAVPLKEGKVRRSSRLHLRDMSHMDLATQTESVKRLAKLENVSLMATAAYWFHNGFSIRDERLGIGSYPFSF